MDDDMKQILCKNKMCNRIFASSFLRLFVRLRARWVVHLVKSVAERETSSIFFFLFLFSPRSFRFVVRFFVVVLCILCIVYITITSQTEVSC